MKTILRTAVGTLGVALLLGMSPGNAAAAYGYQCGTEYRNCLAAGIDPDTCMDAYWLCRFGYLPAKSATQMIASDRR